jgi:hypothetical protein
VRALVAEACRIRLTNSELTGAVDTPRGLDPAVYKTFRRPMPLCAPELVRRGRDTVALLIERWRWTMGAFRFSPGDDGTRELDAFRLSIVMVPGEAGDTRARHFLKSVLSNAVLTASWRQRAAVSLGMCGGIEGLGLLLQRLDEKTESTAVRDACARALGRVPDRTALDAIEARLSAMYEDPQVHRSLLCALGLLGSSWGWESRGEALKETAETLRARCNDLLLSALRSEPAEAETIGEALALVAWPSAADSVARLADDSAATPAQRQAAARVLPLLR